jgi:hypothetical protein
VERSAGRAGALERQGGYRDEPVPEAEARGPLQWDERPSALAASDAWDGAHRDAAADAAHPLPLLRDADAGKSAARALADPARGARSPPQALARWVDADVAGEPYRPDAAQSGARSYAARAWAALPPLAVGRLHVEQVAPAVPEPGLPMPWQQALPTRVAQQPRAEVRDGLAQPPEVLEERRAFPPPASQLLASWVEPRPVARALLPADAPVLRPVVPQPASRPHWDGLPVPQLPSVG